MWKENPMPQTAWLVDYLWCLLWLPTLVLAVPFASGGPQEVRP